MPVANQNKISSVWILGKHPLVAKYLLEVLGRDSSIQAAWAEGGVPIRNESGEDPVFVMDDVPLDAPVSRSIQNFAQKGESTKYIVLGQHLDVYSVCRLLCQGVHGFLTYDQVNESLLLAIRTVQKGGMWVDSRVLQKYLKLNKREKESMPAFLYDQALTAREEEILHFTQQRLSNKEIAALLNIEVSTVKFHLSNIYSKLQIASRSDLWHNCMGQGVVLPFASNGRHEPLPNAKPGASALMPVDGA